ncbi:MaoC family dehydratase N-terminal domain-containing protein [Pseudomonas sp. RIT-PI-AD]|uniref:MaoC family dehydratase N-terminal domain-containing protein n=1 Tax=Pseudomonas sp. RIT-PI-AD TaxID=3035294 RepID=UPI0021D976B6|nr:MaoC family dehydratase N-terminal domain-containing protein [Pseudomonas sp. RIT-PI-AD]
MSLLSPSIKSRIGTSLPPLRFEVTRSDLRKYAVATGQRQARYLEGDEAPLLFLFSVLMPILPLEQLLEDGRQPDSALLPELPLKRIMAGGSEYEVHRRIFAGDVLMLRQTLADIYEKQGAEGPLIFLVFENRFESETGEPLVTERLIRIAR